eukprot:GDKJ01059365.1.p1 GENE.GDKJ01059365.1~~GDKJ01059365.1.p1  ORF type:complete len:1074 (+),score=293.88 GDKJ01059365.1:54-3224(+)
MKNANFFDSNLQRALYFLEAMDFRLREAAYIKKPRNSILTRWKEITFSSDALQAAIAHKNFDMLRWFLDQKDICLEPPTSICISDKEPLTVITRDYLPTSFFHQIAMVNDATIMEMFVESRRVVSEGFLKKPLECQKCLGLSYLPLNSIRSPEFHELTNKITLGGEHFFHLKLNPVHIAHAYLNEKMCEILKRVFPQDAWSSMLRERARVEFHPHFDAALTPRPTDNTKKKFSSSKNRTNVRELPSSVKAVAAYMFEIYALFEVSPIFYSFLVMPDQPLEGFPSVLCSPPSSQSENAVDYEDGLKRLLRFHESEDRDLLPPSSPYIQEFEKSLKLKWKAFPDVDEIVSNLKSANYDKYRASLSLMVAQCGDGQVYHNSLLKVLEPPKILRLLESYVKELEDLLSNSKSARKLKIIRKDVVELMHLNAKKDIQVVLERKEKSLDSSLSSSLGECQEGSDDKFSCNVKNRSRCFSSGEEDEEETQNLEEILNSKNSKKRQSKKNKKNTITAPSGCAFQVLEEGGMISKDSESKKEAQSLSQQQSPQQQQNYSQMNTASTIHKNMNLIINSKTQSNGLESQQQVALSAEHSTNRKNNNSTHNKINGNNTKNLEFNEEELLNEEIDVNLDSSSVLSSSSQLSFSNLSSSKREKYFRTSLTHNKKNNNYNKNNTHSDSENEFEEFKGRAHSTSSSFSPQAVLYTQQHHRREANQESIASPASSLYRQKQKTRVQKEEKREDEQEESDCSSTTPLLFKREQMSSPRNNKNSKCKLDVVKFTTTTTTNVIPTPCLQLLHASPCGVTGDYVASQPAPALLMGGYTQAAVIAFFLHQQKEQLLRRGPEEVICCGESEKKEDNFFVSDSHSQREENAVSIVQASIQKHKEEPKKEEDGKLIAPSSVPSPSAMIPEDEEKKMKIDDETCSPPPVELLAQYEELQRRFTAIQTKRSEVQAEISCFVGKTDYAAEEKEEKKIKNQAILDCRLTELQANEEELLNKRSSLVKEVERTTMMKEQINKKEKLTSMYRLKKEIKTLLRQSSDLEVECNQALFLSEVLRAQEFF